MPPQVAAPRRSAHAVHLAGPRLVAGLSALVLATAAGVRLETVVPVPPHDAAVARPAHASPVRQPDALAGRTAAVAPDAQTVTPDEPGARRSVRQGVYTAAQAERGRRLFDDRCVSCHQPDQYVGEGFLKSWAGQTADSLFDLLRTTMPQDNPGSLKPQAYADLLAYLFQLNGLPPGDTELKAVSRVLRLVVIEGPDKPPHQ